MSSNKLERIKGLRAKKGPNNYDKFFPFGSSGQLIDMYSKLDLEEELRLGGNRYIEIKEQEKQVTIKEWYYLEPKGNRTKEYMRLHSLCGYSVKTVFQDYPVSTAVDVGGDHQNPQLLIEDEDQNFIVLKEDNLQTTIEIELYKGDMEEIKGYEYEVKEWQYDPEYPEGSEGAEEHRTPVSYWSEEDDEYEEHRTPIYISPIHVKHIKVNDIKDGIEMLNEELIPLEETEQTEGGD